MLSNIQFTAECMVSDTRYAKTSRRSRWCSAGFWAFPALNQIGDTFHFLDVPGSSRSHQYIFLIHNYQLWILFSPILYTLSTTIHTIIPTKYQTISYSQISKYHSYFLSRHSISLSTIYSPSQGTLFPDKNIPKYTPIPSPTYIHNSLIFHQKYLKWLKIYIFKSVAHSVTS